MQDLNKDSVVVITVPLDQTSFSFHSSFLTMPEEFLQWNQKRQITFQAGRTVLYSFLEKFASEVLVNSSLAISEHGKPYLTNRAIEFNISHTDNLLVAIFAPFAVGIDVEVIKPRKSLDAIIERMLNNDEQNFLACEPNLKLERFFYLWTIKEALVKTTGRGLVDLNNFVIEPTKQQVIHMKSSMDNGVFLDGTLYTYEHQQKAMSFYLPKTYNLKDVTFLEYNGNNDLFTSCPQFMHPVFQMQICAK